jgi:hypothetical protein
MESTVVDEKSPVASGAAIGKLRLWISRKREGSQSVQSVQSIARDGFPFLQFEFGWSGPGSLKESLRTVVGQWPKPVTPTSGLLWDTVGNGWEYTGQLRIGSGVYTTWRRSAVFGQQITIQDTARLDGTGTELDDQ